MSMIVIIRILDLIYLTPVVTGTCKKYTLMGSKQALRRRRRATGGSTNSSIKKNSQQCCSTRSSSTHDACMLYTFHEIHSSSFALWIMSSTIMGHFSCVNGYAMRILLPQKQLKLVHRVKYTMQHTEKMCLMLSNSHGLKICHNLPMHLWV